MNETSTATRSVIIERDIAHPPEKIWRALTQPHLMEEWLMKSNFEPVAGKDFRFTADWGSVDCKVLEIDPYTTLAYQWDAMGLESVVTWTLTPTSAGSHLRMEQAGFRQDQEQAYRGAQYGWTNFLGQLDQVLAKLD
jgi:uncharacterized protein YndB with AHSA1/START domain